MQKPSHKSAVVTGCSLILVLCLLVCGLVWFWFMQPWLPYTDPDIQHALEVYFGNRDPRLRGFWDSSNDCRVAIADINGLNSGRGTYYVTLYKQTDNWQVVREN